MKNTRSVKIAEETYVDCKEFTELKGLKIQHYITTAVQEKLKNDKKKK